ncbi:MAG: hypothetical protein ACYDDD_02355 [Acidithiobacillus ferrivorans]
MQLDGAVSVPVTSQILATLREPQEKRVIWTMMSTAEAICSRMDGGEW